MHILAVILFGILGAFQFHQELSPKAFALAPERGSAF